MPVGTEGNLPFSTEVGENAEGGKPWWLGGEWNASPTEVAIPGGPPAINGSYWPVMADRYVLTSTCCARAAGGRDLDHLNIFLPHLPSHPSFPFME